MSTGYVFPEAVLEPGEERVVEVNLGGSAFRAQRLTFIAHMAEVRGHFKIRHTQRPLLNRENVIAYSDVKRRRTTVEYRDRFEGNFIRSYLPATVEYVHTNPLSYISLLNVFCGTAGQMTNAGNGIPTAYFGAECHGNMLAFPTTDMSMSLLLKNHGDIQIKVNSAVFGRSR